MLIKAIRILLGFIRPFPWVLPCVAVLGLMASLAEGLGIGLLIPFLSSLTGASPEGGGLVTRWLESYSTLFPDSMQIVAVAVTISLLVISSSALSLLYLNLLAWAAARVTHDVRVSLLERFLHSHQFFLEPGSQGRQIKAIDGSAFRTGQATISFFLLCANASTALVILVLLMLISWRMTSLVLIGVAAAGLIVRIFIKYSLRNSDIYEQVVSRLNDLSMNVLSSLRMVRIFGQEQHELDFFRDTSEQVRQSQYKLELAKRTMGPLIDSFSAPMLVTAMVVAHYADVSVVILLPFLLLVFRLQRYVRECDVNRVRVAADAGAIFEVDELLQTIDSVDVDQGEAITQFKQHVAFRNVSYVHQNDVSQTSVVDSLNLTINCGETLGIVGESGSGKSTLINLLCGFYTPVSGVIEVDGREIAALKLSHWRKLLGFSGQDGELRSGTVFENIAYGTPQATQSEVEAAARKASAHEFIVRLPAAYQTNVGQRGMQLSGGQRQRIALARALLRKPRILILDEATNAVDNETEADISQALQKISGSLTMIIIAHRLSSVAHADRVIVMSGGKIIEDNTPEALRLSNGVYSRLVGFEADSRLTGGPVNGLTGNLSDSNNPPKA